MITFTDVVKNYGTLRVLGPVSGQIPAGGVTALVGPNGAGKSTLLTVIGRLLDPSSGEVSVGGLNVRTTRSRELATRLAVLRQENSVTAKLTVRELVGFGRFPHSQGRLVAADHAAIDHALAFLDLTELAGRHIDELSGGQRQRAFIAMVIAQDTDYLLLDEPLNNLDLQHSVHMMGRLRQAADELGKTVVLIVHDINVAARYADRVLALNDGTLAVAGTVDEIMRDDVLSTVFNTPVEVHSIRGQPYAVPVSTVPPDAAP